MEKESLSLLTTLGAPILVIIGGIITWFLKTKKEELQEMEKRAIEKRIEIYTTILQPFIIIFSNSGDKKNQDKAVAQIVSVEYKKASFNLITFGSDEMVTSYNNMMQCFYKNEGEKDPKIIMQNFARFLLSIRKDVYNKNTKLDDWDMLKFMITDIEKIIN